MAKFVKLGEKATMFFDPTINLKVLPNKIVELPKNYRRGKLTAKALRSGHLKETNEKDNWDDDDIDFDNIDYSESKLMKMKQVELVEVAAHNESDYTEDELGDMKKKELVEEILALIE